MRRLILVGLFALLPFLGGWPSNMAGGTGGGTGGGGGGGSACAAPNNYLSAPAAAHLYFWNDTSWAVAGDPDDEASGTDQALETSANLSDSSDLSSADLPPGTPGVYTAVDMDGSTETAYTNAATLGFIVATDFGDYTTCFWTKLAELDAGVNHVTFWSFGQNDDGWVGFNTDGSVQTNSPGATALTSAASAIATGSWRHVCVTADGANDGVAIRKVYVDGLQVAADGGAVLNLYFNGGGTHSQGINAVHASLNHQFAIWHSALSQSQIQELGCCGFNGEADPTAREAIIGGAGGTTCAGF